MSSFLKKIMIEKQIEDLNKENKVLQREILRLRKELETFRDKLQQAREFYKKNYQKIETQHARHTSLYETARLPIKEKAPKFSIEEIRESLNKERSNSTKLTELNKKRINVYKRTKKFKSELNSFVEKENTKKYLVFKSGIEKKTKEFKLKLEELKDKNAKYEMNNQAIIEKTEELLKIDDLNEPEYDFEEQMKSLGIQGKKRKRSYQRKRKSKRKPGKKKRSKKISKK